VLNWRRVTDPVTSKPKSFGFCDFDNADGALKALRALNGLKIDGGEIMAKVDEKEQKLLDEHTAKKPKVKENGAPDTPDQDEDRTKNAIAFLMYKRDKGEEYKNFVFDPVKYREFEKRQRKEREESEEELAERERKRQAERDREKEKEQRRKEREERDFREKEKEWESREYAKIKEKEREMERERRERDRDLKDLEFDDAERKKRSREYEKRKREREKERDEDDTDRTREQEELDMIKKRELAAKEEQEMRDSIVPEPSPIFVESPVEDDSSVDKSKLASIAMPFVGAPPKEKKPVLPVVPGFNAEPEIDELYVKKKRKLITLESALHEETDRKAKLEQLKTIIDTIPTTKEHLFSYPISWDVVDQNNIVDKKMRPWVTKKIVEYLGEEEKTLIDFILNKISGHTTPAEIVDQLQLVLDEEAEVFLVKMWRMLIFEMLTCSKPQ